MPARYNFNVAEIQKRLDAAIFEGTLEAMVETQTELQKIVSTPGRGRVYAKTAQGVRRLDQFMAQNVGLNRANQERVSAAMAAHGVSRSRRRFNVRTVLDEASLRRYQMTRKMVAMRKGFNLSEGQMQGLIASKRGARNLGDVGLHRASAPGDPPTVKFGGLRKAIQVARPRRKASGPLKGWELTIRIRYAKWLEEGTGRMAARPYIAPTLSMMRPRVADMILDRIRSAGFQTP